MILYVDDIILTRINDMLIQNLIMRLHHKFQLHNLGAINQFLGIQFQHNSSNLFLTQSTYAAKIIQCAKMTTCKPITTPIALMPSTLTNIAC